MNENKKMIDFKVYVNNPKFDNDDNPYGQFRLHQYTNMKNLTDTDEKKAPDGFWDINVPIPLCK